MPVSDSAAAGEISTPKPRDSSGIGFLAGSTELVADRKGRLLKWPAGKYELSP
jgi:hypothetical protein